jgi:hypothetical protein
VTCSFAEFGVVVIQVAVAHSSGCVLQPAATAAAFAVCNWLVLLPQLVRFLLTAYCYEL